MRLMDRQPKSDTIKINDALIFTGSNNVKSFFVDLAVVFLD